MFSTIPLHPLDLPNGTFFGWGSYQIQSGNLIVIIIMLVLFALALVLPFTGARGSK